LPTDRLTDAPTFVIDEIGLSSRQVWAAALGELARRGEVGRAELESWLRPAALIGRDGPTLIIGAPNAVTRDRIARRLLPAVREALGATIGAPVAVSVVVAERG
jgi:chromosomal replication initiation ATPase DnaA